LYWSREKVLQKSKQLQRGLEAVEKSKLLGALVNSSANTATVITINGTVRIQLKQAKE